MLLKSFAFILSFLLFITNSLSFAHQNQLLSVNYYDMAIVEKVSVYHTISPSLSAKLSYPVLSSRDINLQANIKSINQATRQWINNQIVDFKNQTKQLHDLQARFPKKIIKNQLFIDFDSTLIAINKNQFIISLRFNVQGFMTGMAHPFNRYQTFTYHINTGQLITLQNLFRPNADYLSTFAIYAEHYLSERKVALIKEGLTPIPTNYRNWNITANGILITFDRAQVAPSVYGSQVVLIPYIVLRSLLSPNSLIKACVKQKHCTSSNRHFND